MQGMLRGTDLVPGSGRSPRGGHGNPRQYSCLENPMDIKAWRATVHGVTKSWTHLKCLSTAQLSTIALHSYNILNGKQQWRAYSVSLGEMSASIYYSVLATNISWQPAVYQTWGMCVCVCARARVCVHVRECVCVSRSVTSNSLPPHGL